LLSGVTMTVKKGYHTEDSELRRGAEKRHGESKGAGSRTGDEASRLLHELEIHRIELEMQNEELIKARNQVETVLEKYSDLYEFAPVGYFTLNRAGTIGSVNVTGSSLLGLERSELNGRRFQLFVADADRPVFNAFLEKAFMSLAKETCEVALLNAGVSRIIGQIEALAAASGQECRIAVIDISDRKRADEALQKVEEAADEALQKVEAAVDQALRQVEETEGLPRQVEETAKEARRKVEETAKDARHKVEGATLEARRKVTEAAKTAEKLLREKGSTALAFGKIQESAELARIKVEKATEAAFQKVRATAEVLQKGKEASDIFRQEKAVAEAATRAKSQFLANMSHELRTPMTGVLGMLDLALSGNLEADQREFLSAAHSSALSLVRILNDILDLTKIEMGKLLIEDKPFDLRQCVEDTLNILYPVVKIKGIGLDFTVAGDVPKVMIGDQARINQVLTNLAGNAVKFTEKGKVEIRVSAGRSAPGAKRKVTFSVADTGIGIPGDKNHLLFHSFSQVDGSHSRSYGGTGLGLAISKEIVERMGGTITFSSEEGVGSTFSFSVPMAEAPRGSDLQSAALSQPAQSAAPAPERAKLRLLLAEDDATILKFLGLMLNRANYQVDFAENGMKAVEMWEKGAYDLLLMDVQMPRLNGFEATGAIREKERKIGGHTPIVAMTAHASKEDEQRCLDAGMDAFIPKPIDFAATLLVIEEILQRESGGVS
jgi:PAS domain S-box-containing protein